MDDNSSLLSAMYQDDDTEPQTKPTPTQPSGSGRTRKVRVGVVEYELPTVGYVTRLEQMLLRQQHTLDMQQRAITRLQNSLVSASNLIRRHGNATADLREELSHKVDSLDL
jgi:hypothetical protein